jgi:hypothetical protein
LNHKLRIKLFRYNNSFAVSSPSSRGGFSRVGGGRPRNWSARGSDLPEVLLSFYFLLAALKSILLLKD